MRTVNPSITNNKKVVSILITCETKNQGKGSKSVVDYMWQ